MIIARRTWTTVRLVLCVLLSPTRSFAPLVAPSKSTDNLQALANLRRASFLGQSGSSHSVQRSFKSCTSYKSCTAASNKAGEACTRSGSEADLAGKAAAAAEAEAVHGSAGSLSGHRLAVMRSRSHLAEASDPDTTEQQRQQQGALAASGEHEVGHGIV